MTTADSWRNRPWRTAALAAACALALVAPAAAGPGKGGGRAHVKVPAGATTSAAGAKLDIQLRDKSNGKWVIRFQLIKAPAGVAPEVYVDDGTGTGTFALVGPLAPDAEEETVYRLRLRAQDGAALPAGAGALADLGGRAYEVRLADGDPATADEVIVAGNLPSLDPVGNPGHGGGGQGQGGSGGNGHGKPK